MEKEKESKEKKKPSMQGLDFASLVGALNDVYGAGAAMSGNSGPVANVEAISSGSLALDLAIGINGWPRGRIIEIYGLESSGKTTTALHAIASAQKAGGNAVFIDAEHALDPEWAKIIGVDMNKLIVHQPDYGEQALDFACDCIESGAVDVIVVDSVAALIPKEELDGNIGDVQMGAMARMMSKAMRKMSALASKGKTSVIFLNQVRQKIGPMVFGNPNTTPGGNALKFYASVRVEVVKGGKIASTGSVVQRVDSDTEVIGQEIKIKIVKNKVAAPFKTAIVHLMFDDKNGQYGFSPISELIDIGTDVGILRRAGSNYYYEELKLGAGRVNAIATLANNKELFEKIKAVTQTKMATMTRKFVVVDESELDTKIDKQFGDE